MESFQLPNQEQDASGLMKLPVEIRLKILRYTLKHEGALFPIHWSSQDYTKNGFELSSQILRACQQLYNECLPILYHENVLVVKFKSSILQIKQFEILRWTLPLQSMENVTLLSLAKTQRTAFSDAVQICENYPILCRFQNLYIQIDYAGNDDVLYACRIVADLLHQKKVTLTIHQQKPFMNRWGRMGSDKLEWLQLCRYLRCESIVFPGYEKETQSLVQTITSDEPVVDTFKILTQLYRDVFKPLPTLPYQGSLSRTFDRVKFTDTYSKELASLSRYAVTYDVQAFEKMKQRLLYDAAKWAEYADMG